MLTDASPEFLSALAARLPEGRLTPPQPHHLEEPRGRWPGRAAAVAQPRSVEEVSVILQACNEAGVAVVPWGGGTGLVGGQVMGQGPLPLVLSLEKMRAIRAVYPTENTLIAEAGAKLAEVQAAAAAQGRLFPLSLASEGSCSIGGNLSTNAGGVNVLRYGNARELCLGVEAVLADGTILRGLKRLRKDNTGYDIRNLLIGAEGTLGVITAAALRLVSPPPVTGVALMVVKDPQAALDLLALAEGLVPGCVSAFELLSRMGLSFLAEAMPDLRQPFDPAPEWFVLIELGLPHGLDPEASLQAIFEAGVEAGLVDDGLIAQSKAQAEAFWAIRENIPHGNKFIGSISSHDVSLPLSEIPGFIKEAGCVLHARAELRINCFGHLGDGNLHYNLFPSVGKSRAAYEDIKDELKTIVHDMVHARGGSVSAEHGIGRLKVGDLERYGDKGRLAAMRAVKAALDPKGILNPGAILR